MDYRSSLCRFAFRYGGNGLYGFAGWKKGIGRRIGHDQLCSRLTYFVWRVIPLAGGYLAERGDAGSQGVGYE